MCRYGADCGTCQATFCAHVRCAEVRPRSADLCLQQTQGRGYLSEPPTSIASPPPPLISTFRGRACCDTGIVIASTPLS
jgi:hypothetical protein